jgi:hypothetical protein
MSGSPARAVAAAGLATAAGVAAFTLFVALLAPPATAAATEVPGRLAAGDLVLRVQWVGWMAHDPAAPSAPGTRRLRLDATLSNLGRGVVAVVPGEFELSSADRDVPPVSGPAAETLEPGRTCAIDLRFDVPETASRLDLLWVRDGQVLRLQVAPDQPAVARR